MMYYLDNAATSPMDPEVVEAMIGYMKTEYGNPSSKYYPQAISANQALKDSRKSVADLLGCDPEYVIFTSGASESNNFVLKGVFEKYRKKGQHIITTKIEHKSIMSICEHLEKLGGAVTYLDIDQDGHINLDELRKSIREDTILVSIMWGNNEIGTLNDIKKIGEICRDNDVLFHTDATQVVGKIDFNLRKLKVDFLSFSAHKIYGPKGIGTVYIGPDDLGLRRKVPSLIDGGDQEYKMRAGTHAMHNIIGFAKACELAKKRVISSQRKLIEAEKMFKKELLNIREDIIFNGDQEKKIPGLISVNIPGINNELFCKDLSDKIALSTGSACSIGEKSYVLEALKIKNPQNTIRISFSHELEDVQDIIETLKPYIDSKK